MNDMTNDTYWDGTPRPQVMAQLPAWALKEMLGRHGGPALEAARAEADHRTHGLLPLPEYRWNTCRICGGDHIPGGCEV